MDIKTDWTPDDYYNIHDDLTRTEGNIHEIAAVLSAAGRPASLDEDVYKRQELHDLNPEFRKSPKDIGETTMAWKKSPALQTAPEKRCV